VERSAVRNVCRDAVAAAEAAVPVFAAAQQLGSEQPRIAAYAHRHGCRISSAARGAGRRAVERSAAGAVDGAASNGAAGDVFARAAVGASRPRQILADCPGTVGRGPAALEPGILGCADDTPEQLASGGVDYTQNFAKSNANHGMATRMLKTYFDQVPGSVAALDANPQVRAALRAQLARDTELGTMMGGPRADVARAKQIMAESGYKGLFEALAKGEVLPSVLIPLGLAGTYEAGSPRE
jgi:hypothetical protein